MNSPEHQKQYEDKNYNLYEEVKKKLYELTHWTDNTEWTKYREHMQNKKNSQRSLNQNVSLSFDTLH